MHNASAPNVCQRDTRTPLGHTTVESPTLPLALLPRPNRQPYHSVTIRPPQSWPSLGPPPSQPAPASGAAHSRRHWRPPPPARPGPRCRCRGLKRAKRRWTCGRRAWPFAPAIFCVYPKEWSVSLAAASLNHITSCTKDTHAPATSPGGPAPRRCRRAWAR